MAQRSTYVAVGAVVVAVAAGALLAGMYLADDDETTVTVNPVLPMFAYLAGGAEEVAAPGDADGIGTAVVEVDRQLGEVCIDLTTNGVSAWTTAHIQHGARGVDGPVVVDFNLTPADVGPTLSRCVTDVDGDLVSSIADEPGDYYVNVHTAEFTGGAVRGQLGTRGRETLLSTPTRVYDSRQADGKLAVDTTRTIDLQLPDGARAALITLTVDGTEGGGYVTAYANDAVLPPTSTINWAASDQVVATTTTVAVDRDGLIKLTAGQNGAHVIVDVLGFIA